MGLSVQECPLARVYMEAYRWQLRRSEDKYGLRIGTELQLTPRISVDMGYNKPESMSTVVRNGKNHVPSSRCRYGIWFGGKPSIGCKTSVRANMLEIRSST